MIIKFNYRKSMLSNAIAFIANGEVEQHNSVEFDSKFLTKSQRTRLLPFVDIKNGTNAYFYCDGNDFPEFNKEPSFDECLNMVVEWTKSSGLVPNFINNVEAENLKHFWYLYENYPLTAFIFGNYNEE